MHIPRPPCLSSISTVSIVLYFDHSIPFCSLPNLHIFPLHTFFLFLICLLACFFFNFSSESLLPCGISVAFFLWYFFLLFFFLRRSSPGSVSFYPNAVSYRIACTSVLFYFIFLFDSGVFFSTEETLHDIFNHVFQLIYGNFSWNIFFIFFHEVSCSSNVLFLIFLFFQSLLRIDYIYLSLFFAHFECRGSSRLSCWWQVGVWRNSCYDWWIWVLIALCGHYCSPAIKARPAGLPADADSVPLALPTTSFLPTWVMVLTWNSLILLRCTFKNFGVRPQHSRITYLSLPRQDSSEY